MEFSTEQDPDGESAEARARPLLEDALRRSVTAMRMASGDVFLAAHTALQVLDKLRKVAPDLVAAAEDEVERGI